VTKFGPRRGIASIVGSMIFLILMTSGISVYFLSMQVQSDLIDTQQKVSGAEIRKIQEKYAISVMTDSNDNNRLTIQVKNEGPFPLEIADIWIINKTDAINGYPAARHLLNSTDSFIPIGYGKNILENKPLYMNPAEYDIKVISTIGTIRITDIDINGNNDLFVELISIPPDVRKGENVTLSMRVTNVGGYDITDISPYDPPAVNPSASIISSAMLSSPTIDILRPGDSGFFRWHYQVTGTPGTNVEFTSNATGTMGAFSVNSNNDTDAITLREPDESELIVIAEDLLARPSIFIILPNPFGDDNEKALWGINIVNPTPQSMQVSKIVFQVSTTRATGTDKIFNDQSCDATTVAPTPVGTWNCPVMNQLMWKNLSTPATVPGFSVVPFLAKVQPGSLTGGSDILESIPVQVDVFTTLGQFGKSGYSTSLDNTNQPLANVFLTKGLATTAESDIMANMTGISSSSVVKFNATLADFDTGTSDFIDGDATDKSRLIVNIPKGWSTPTVLSNVGFNAPIVNSYADGSSQISAELSSDLTGSGGTGRTIQFESTAPTVTTTQMYVMYILADGTTNNGDLAIGPLAEIVLQVIP